MGFRISVVVWVVPTTSFRKPYSHSPTAKIFGEGIVGVGQDCVDSIRAEDVVASALELLCAQNID
jgi:hypothetical protein